jgi:hypothetical protein
VTSKALRDVAAIEYIEEVLDSAIGKLRAAGKDGARLTEPECRILFAWIKERPKAKRPRGRPSDAAWIAIDCQLSEGVMPLKAAVQATADDHGVSRATVYAARRKFFPSE